MNLLGKAIGGIVFKAPYVVFIASENDVLGDRLQGADRKQATESWNRFDFRNGTVIVTDYFQEPS